MTLEPKKVEPGFQSRWLKQALELVMRNFHLWFAAGIALTAFSYAAGKVFGPLTLVVGLFCVCFSTGLARHSDKNTLNFTSLTQEAGLAAQFTISLIKERWLAFALVIVGGYFLGNALVAAAEAASQGTAPAPPPPDLSKISTWLFSSYSPLIISAGSIYVGCLLQTTGIGFNGLGYPLRQRFGLNYKEAELLIFKAVRLNPLASTFPDMVVMLSMMVSMFLLPVLIPFVMCFIPALLYVAYREVFEGEVTNTAEKPVEQVNAATAGAAS